MEQATESLNERPESPMTATDVLAGGGEMGALMRVLNWAATPIGPVASWPQSLRTSVSICLNSRFPILIWWGPELVMLYNDAYRPMLGMTKHPGAMGQRGRECWPEIWHIIGPMLEDVLTTGNATWSDDQLLVLDRSGYLEECYFTFSYSPIRDESGGVGGVFCAVTETTQRVLSERRLRTLRDLADRTTRAQAVTATCELAMAALADAPADIPFAALYLHDPIRRSVRLVGTAGLPADTRALPQEISLDPGGAALHTGWPLVQSVQQGVPVLVDDLRQRFSEFPGGPWQVSPTTALVLPVIAADDAQPAALLIVGISPRRALDDAYCGFLHLVANQIASALTAAHAYEAERQRAEALAEIDRAKTAFFSNVSHEFRTPLTLLLVPLEDTLAHANGLPADDRERLEVSRRNAVRLLKLVNTLLDFSRIEAGRLQASYMPTDLAAFTADLASVFRSAIERAGLRLIVTCPPLVAPVYVDREMWEKIVLNLLSNALKFTFAGEIEVSLRQAGAQVQLSVRDTGMGIPTEELPHLFERFHRVKGARGRTFEGSGIGLALVQELVKLHSGQIHVVSEVDRGTTFTISIPTGTAHLPADRIAAERMLESTSVRGDTYLEEALRWLPEERSAFETSAPTLSGASTPASGGEHVAAQPASRARILLADDNADMREYIHRLLSQDYDVVAVNDGAAALQAAQHQPFDLVLSDVMMPHLDGLGLLTALRADEHTKTLPIMLLSARAGEESRIEGIDAGADDYLIKPFSARELLARVRMHVNMARIRREAEAAIRVSEERFRKIFEYAAIGIAIVDWQGRFIQVNPAYAAIVGYTEEELSQMTFATLVHPDDSAANMVDVHRVMNGELPFFQVENRYLRKNGEPVWVQKFVSILCDEAGVPVSLIALVTDITERKYAEHALRHQNERLALLSDALAGLLNTRQFDQITRDLFPKVAAHLGVDTYFNYMVNPQGDALRLQASAGIPEATARQIERLEFGQAICGTVAQTRQPIVAHDIQHSDDEKAALVRGFGIQAYACNPLMSGDQLLGTLSFATRTRTCFDESELEFVQLISRYVAVAMERVQIEAALRESEERQRIAASAAGLGVFEWKVQEDKALWENERMYAIFGHRREDGSVNKRQFFAYYLHPDDREMFEQALLAGMQPGVTFYATCRIRRKSDGELRWLEFAGNFALASDGIPLKLVGVIADITERKQAEQALQESQHFLSTITDAVPSLIYVYDLDTHQNIYVNNRLTHLFGYTQADLAAMGEDFLSRLIHPDDLALLAHWREQLSTLADGVTLKVMYRFLHKDGSWHWVSGQDAIFKRHPDGSSWHVLGVLDDITERKQTEESLRASEYRLRIASDAANIGIHDYDIVNDRILWDEKVRSIWGVGPDEQVTYQVFVAGLHPDDRDAAQAAANWALNPAGDGKYTAEYRVIHRENGRERWVAATGQVFFEQGRAVRLIGTAQDISERKHAEEALRRVSAERDRQAHFFDTTLSTVKDYVYMFDRESRFLYANQTLLDLWGLTSEEAIGKTMADLNYSEEVETRLLEGIREVFATRQTVTNETFYTNRAGQGGYYENILSPVFAADGTVDFVTGSSRDVTERKHAEMNAAFLAEIGKDLARLSTADEIMRTVGEKIGRYLDVSRVFFVELDPSNTLARVLYDWCKEPLPSTVGVHQLADYGRGDFMHDLAAGNPIVINDVTSSHITLSSAEKFAALQIGASLNAPYISDGRLKFVLAVQHRQAHQWRNDEIELICELSARIWMRLERAQAEAAMRESEERFRHMSDHAPVMVWLTNADGACTYISASWYAFTGQTPETALGFGWFASVHPDDLADVEQTVLAARVQYSATRMEYRLRRKDGTYCWFLDSAVPRFSPDGVFLGYIGSVLDITERKFAEEQLQHSEATQRAYAARLQQLNAASLAINAAPTRDEVLQLVTEKARVLIGAHVALTSTTSDQAESQAIIQVSLSEKYIPERDYDINPAWSALSLLVCQSGQSMRLTQAELESHPAWKDIDLGSGKHTPVRGWLAAPLVGLDGRIMGLIQLSDRYAGEFTAEDEALLVQLAQVATIALENRQLYEQEQRARTQAEEASRLKDEFLATVSHELRTPLTAFLGYAQLLQSRKRDEVYIARTVEKLVRSARAQSQIIEDLLDVSRIVSGKLRITLEPIDFIPVIRAALDTVRPTMEAKELHLHLDLRPEDSRIMGDANRLQQVVWNLVSNAAKFTPSGGTIEVRLEPHGRESWLTVSDTGEGISSAFLPYVFDRFRQANSTSSRTHGGLGLGLAIVRHLVELHGGTVQVASSGEGQGASFTVRLPLALTHEAAAGISTPTDTDHTIIGCPPELRGLRVLLVDDQPDILDILHEILTPCGAIVQTCTTARDALELVRTWQPDVLVSDIAMPGEDGYWLIRNVRARTPADGSSIPAIALTAYIRVEDRIQVLAAGFQQYVPKPIDPDELRHVIAHLAQTAIYD